MPVKLTVDIINSIIITDVTNVFFSPSISRHNDGITTQLFYQNPMWSKQDPMRESVFTNVGNGYEYRVYIPKLKNERFNRNILRLDFYTEHKIPLVIPKNDIFISNECCIILNDMIMMWAM